MHAADDNINNQTLDNVYVNFVSDKMFHMMAQIGINRADKITSLEEIGWFDPDVEPKVN